jgi:hypothetical protein
MDAVMRKPAIAIMCLVLASTSAAHAGSARTSLARKDFAAETAARMMVVLIAAAGQKALAQCIHDRYFGSPLLLRRTLWEVWKHPGAEFESALLEATKAACSKDFPDIAESERQAWLRTGNESILLEPGKPATDAAANMIAAYEDMRGDRVSAQCILDEGTRGQANRIVSERLRNEPRLPITLAVYDAYRTICSLNPNGPAASNITLPAMPNVSTVARERLSIVQDFAICQSQGEANEETCVSQAYKTRSKHLYNQLLSSEAATKKMP